MPDMYSLELVKARVAPADEPYEEGIRLKQGRTLPFLVERSWSGPAGSYIEQWSIRRGGKDILFSSDPKSIWVRGPQSIRSFVDRMEEPITLEPGTYNLVFVAEGYFMGSREITASEPGTSNASGETREETRPKEEAPA